MSYCVPGLESGTFSPALEMVENSCLVMKVLRDGAFHAHHLVSEVAFVQVGVGS